MLLLPEHIRKRVHYYLLRVMVMTSDIKRNGSIPLGLASLSAGVLLLFSSVVALVFFGGKACIPPGGDTIPGMEKYGPGCLLMPRSSSCAWLVSSDLWSYFQI